MSHAPSAFGIKARFRPRVLRLVVALGLTAPGGMHAQSNYATPYTFTTVAGAAGSTGTTNGAGFAARFNNPQGLAFDRADNLYIADYNNGLIRKITPAGLVSTFAGATSGGPFTFPVAIAVDAAGTLNVADAPVSAILKVTPAGGVTTFAGTGSGSNDGIGTAARFSAVTGLALDSAGNLFVSDHNNRTIRKITPGAVVTTYAGAVGTVGNADGPVSLARFATPNQLAVDGADNLYVADSISHTIRKITSAGTVTTLAGLSGSLGSADGTGSAARFNNPFGIAVDGAGNIYVADTGNHTIRKITPAGVVTTLAGTPGTAGSADGTGSAAQFNGSRALTVDNAGNIYVSDSLNHTIRRGTLVVGTTLPGIAVPLLLPAGATAIEARALAEQPGGGVLVAISGRYAVKPSGSGAQALLLPNYTNPQPYNLSYVVRLLANGQPDPAFTSAPGGDGTVNTVAVQADGKILVGGTFASFNTVFFKNLARLQADGKADATFLIGSGPDAQVNALAVQPDGKILVGGAFQNFGGQPRPWLLRLSATGAVDPGFSPALNGTVNTLALQADGRIVIGGNFTSVGGTARSRLARLLANGALDPSFDPGAGANDEVVTLAVQSDGKIVAAGDFTTFAGQSRSRLARLLATGALDPAFLSTATANATVLALDVQADGKLVLGGAFTQVNGVARARLARLAADGTLDAAFDPGTGANQSARTVLARGDGTIFLGGSFDQFRDTVVNQVAVVGSVPAVTAFVRAPSAVTVNLGGTARFVAEATGTGALAYQWFKDGVALAGATDATLTLPNASAPNQGRYTLQVTSSSGSILTSGDAALTVVSSAASQIINLSVLTSLDAPDAAFTLGFVIGGAGASGTKPLLVRAAGPALAQFGVANPNADPKLQFFAGPALAGENDNWSGTTALSNLSTQVGAFPYASISSKDAAFAALANLSAPANSVVVSGVAGATGAVLAEVYDATPASANTATTPRLLNVSVLKIIPTGSILTAGFVIRGDTTKTILVRAIGPTLGNFGVGGPLADPKLQFFAGTALVGENDNWSGTAALKAAFTAVGAFALEPTTRDAALLLTLAPGSYTAQVSGVSDSAGAALVEIYEVP